MKYPDNFRPSILLAAAFGIGLFSGGAGKFLAGALVPQARAQTNLSTTASPEEEKTMSGRLPDQAHAMADVGYHFANLWFAADQQNWPLASYYLGETRSHLRWAVQIHPVRQVGTAEVDLRGISDAVDNTLLAGIGKTIGAKDIQGFKTAYRNTLEGCYACHKACQKPYLRPQVPSAVGAPILNFDPNATWPK